MVSVPYLTYLTTLLIPYLHCLSEPWYEVQKLTHGECNGTVCEGIPDGVFFGVVSTLGYRRSCLLSHSCHVGGVSFCYPFLGRFSDPILFFPFSRDNVDGRLFSFLLEGALGCVVPWLLAIETVYVGFPSVCTDWCDRD